MPPEVEVLTAPGRSEDKPGRGMVAADFWQAMRELAAAMKREPRFREAFAQLIAEDNPKLAAHIRRLPGADDPVVQYSAELKRIAEAGEEPPTFDEIHERMNEAGVKAGEWAGVPRVLSGLRLSIEPRYPYSGLNGATLDEEEVEEADDGFTIHNEWYDYERNRTVFVCSDNANPDKRYALKAPNLATRRLDMLIQTMTASDAWNANAEGRAMDKLKGLLPPRMWKSYYVSGCFLETSKRSKVTYIFRRLRPTVAIKASGDNMRFLAALCLHPIGHYQGTWAGTMCPTDDVIAALMLMRGCETKLWARAEHHRSWEPESGL